MSILLSDEEQSDLLDSLGYIIDEYMQLYLHLLAKYNFDEQLYNYLYDILYEQLYLVYDNHLHALIHKSIMKALNIYYKHVMPRRSYSTTFITKQKNTLKLTKQLNYLRNIPQPDQRTETWHKFRYNMITASNAYKAYGTPSKQNELICEKCKPLSLEYTKSRYTDTPFHWGTKFEPVSVIYYEYIYETKIEDFGCLPHPKYPYIGASPDGINVDPTSGLYGRMLEIKNPTTREITGIPKEEYWVQMQLQMEVCGLNHCDFLETKFSVYESKEAFDEDGDFYKSTDNQYKGIMVHFIVNDDNYYEYAPFQCSPEEYALWEENIMKKHENDTWLKQIYWRLDYVSCVLVTRNEKWFQHTRHHLENIWKIIEEERVTGKWIERKAKSTPRKRSNSMGSEEDNTKKPIGKLIIDMSDI